MKKEFLTTALANGQLGMGTSRMFVEFDLENGKVADFVKEASNRVFRNYTAILHWGDINELNGSRCLYVVGDNEVLGKRILRLCDQYKFVTDALNAIKDYCKEGKKNDKVFENSNGEVIYEGGWCGESLLKEQIEIKTKMSIICQTLEDLGYDPNDKESQKRINHNMGIDRVY